jgi:hypothetical protein
MLVSLKEGFNMPVVTEPLSLDDEELRVVRDCAAMVPYNLRKAFLREFARAMGEHSEHGAGLVARVARSIAQKLQSGGSDSLHSSEGAVGSSRARGSRTNPAALAAAEALFRH